MYYPTNDVVDHHIVKYDPVRWLSVSTDHRRMAIIHIARIPPEVRCRYALENDSPTAMKVHLGNYNGIDPIVAKHYMASLRPINTSLRKLSVDVVKNNAVNILRSLIKQDPICLSHDWTSTLWTGISSGDCVECLSCLEKRKLLPTAGIRNLLWVSFFHNRPKCFQFLCSRLSGENTSDPKHLACLLRILDFASDCISVGSATSANIKEMLHTLWNASLSTEARFCTLRYVLRRDHLPLLQALLLDGASCSVDASVGEVNRWIIHASLMSYPSRNCLRWMSTLWGRRVKEALKIAGYRTFI
jgi:hypothetical protein